MALDDVEFLLLPLMHKIDIFGLFVISALLNTGITFWILFHFNILK